MIHWVDAYLFLAAAIFGGAVVSLLWSIPEAVRARTLRADRREAVVSRAHGGAHLHPRVEPRDEDLPVSEAGPYPRLSARVADLEHAFKLLQNEWTDKESRIDALAKRLNRLRKLEEPPSPGVDDTPPPTAQTAQERRNEILRNFRARNGG